jgi:hypothetical protein
LSSPRPRCRALGSQLRLPRPCPRRRSRGVCKTVKVASQPRRPLQGWGGATAHEGVVRGRQLFEFSGGALRCAGAPHLCLRHSGPQGRAGARVNTPLARFVHIVFVIIISSTIQTAPNIKQGPQTPLGRGPPVRKHSSPASAPTAPKSVACRLKERGCLTPVRRPLVLSPPICHNQRDRTANARHTRLTGPARPAPRRWRAAAAQSPALLGRAPEGGVSRYAAQGNSGACIGIQRGGQRFLNRPWPWHSMAQSTAGSGNGFRTKDELGMGAPAGDSMLRSAV